jgi:hypothetical protein
MAAARSVNVLQEEAVFSLDHFHVLVGIADPSVDIYRLHLSFLLHHD